MDIVGYVIEKIGKNNYDDFIAWGFKENPSTYHTSVVPSLWKFQNDIPVKGADNIKESLEKMTDFYLKNKKSFND